jgi:carbonic anhydrase/acetyltransferase-like protein (isoleucine patch superfamily)
VEWCAKGNRIKVGNGCSLGDGCILGDGCRLGDWCSLGDGCILGNGCRLGDGSTFIIDAGCPQNTYRVCLVTVEGIAQIHAGCRRFTLQQAYDHWSNHSEHRGEYVDCVVYLTLVAKRLGLNLGETKGK